MPTTVLTLKPLAAPVANMQAGMAGLARVCGLDGYQIDPTSKTFIGNKLTQLVERPTVKASTLSLVPWLLIGSISDARQRLLSGFGDPGRVLKNRRGNPLSAPSRGTSTASTSQANGPGFEQLGF